MKSVIIFFTAITLTAAPLSGQNSDQSAKLDIMSLAVDSESLDSVPVKVSVPSSLTASQLSMNASDDSGGNVLLTGTPYDSVGVRVPADVTINNQYGEKAQLEGFQLLYGSSEDGSSLDVLSPIGCVMLQIPQTGRIELKIGGKLASEDELRGTYSGSVPLNCDEES
jgi:hypothetical protein